MITDPDVLRYFQNGFEEEHYLVDAIKKYLLSPEQKLFLQSKDISIEDILNGRVEDAYHDEILIMFDDWNSKLVANGVELKFFGF